MNFGIWSTSERQTLAWLRPWSALELGSPVPGQWACALYITFLGTGWVGPPPVPYLVLELLAWQALGQLPGDREDPYPGVDAKVAELSPTSSIFPTSSFLPGNWTKSWAQQQDATVGLNHLQLQLWELGRALAKRSPIKLGQFSTWGLGSLSWFLFHFPGAPRELGLLSPCHIATPEKSLTPLLVL